LLARDHHIEVSTTNAELVDQDLVKNPNSIFGERADPELRLPRAAKLPDDDDVERCSEPRGSLGGHWHPTSRQTDDNRLRGCVPGQGVSQLDTRVATI
jgi:hypothetical protein